MLVNVAIALLWVAIGALILAGAVYLLIRVISLWWTLDGRVVQAIWLVFGILVLIAVLSTLGGGGVAPRPFWGR